MRIQARDLLWILLLVAILARLSLRAQDYTSVQLPHFREPESFVLADGPLSVTSYGSGADARYYEIGNVTLLVLPQSVAEMKLKSELLHSGKQYELVLRERFVPTLERLKR